MLNSNMNTLEGNYSSSFSDFYKKAGDLQTKKTEFDAIRGRCEQVAGDVVAFEAAAEKSKANSLKGKVNSNMSKMLKFQGVGEIPGMQSDLNDAQVKWKQIILLKEALLEAEDAEKRENIQRLTAEVKGHFVSIKDAISEKLPGISIEAANAKQSQDESLGSSKEATGVVMSSYQLGVSAKMIDSLTAQIFSATSSDELGRIRGQIVSTFARLNATIKVLEGQLVKFDDKEAVTIFNKTVALIKGVNGQLLMSGGIVDSKQGEFNIKQEVQGLQADMVSKVAALTAQGKQNITISALSQERGVKGITQLINLTILVNIVAGVTILLILAFIGRRMFTLVIGSLDKMVKAVLDIEQTGDFSKRVKVERDDEVGKIGTAFNSLIQMSQNAIKDITRVMSKVAEGDFSHQVEVDLKGDLGALKSNINASLKTLRFSMQELSDAMSALNEGNFDKRMSLQAFDVIVAPVNSALASLEAIVANINNIVSAMASNDLSKRVSVEARGQLDQLKSNINRTVQELSKTIKDIDLGASQVAAATHESSASVDQVKASSGEQLTYIESILSAITQTTGAVVEVGKNTEMASQSARETAEIIGKSSADMDRMSEVMKKIEENSQKISSITKVISGIASQTNLLSLNAAIEAARAGESGKGFAVVAEEVRKLAESSASSALEISELVSQAVTAVEQGVSVSSDVGTGMKKVIGSATTTDEMLARIAAAMEESAASMQEVNDDVGKLRNLGEGNASAAAELGNIMVNLSDIAEQTKVQLEAFKV